MTKLRAPLSIEQALARVVGQLADGYETASEITGKQAGSIRAWGDPDRREQLPVDCAIALDLAYQAAGGTGAPIFEAYAAKLELAEMAKFADRHHLLSHAEMLAKEGGEAQAALLRACQPGASDADCARAFRELSESFEQHKSLLALLAPKADAQPP